MIELTLSVYPAVWEQWMSPSERYLRTGIINKELIWLGTQGYWNNFTRPDRDRVLAWVNIGNSLALPVLRSANPLISLCASLICKKKIMFLSLFFLFSAENVRFWVLISNNISNLGLSGVDYLVIGWKKILFFPFTSRLLSHS